MICTRCQWVNPIGVSTCRRCGERLESVETSAPVHTETSDGLPCPRCGAAMPTEARFCGVCGSALQDSSCPQANPGKPDADSTVIKEKCEDDSENFVASATLENSLREMVLIPACRFLMGASGELAKEDEVPAHYVRLSSFLIDRAVVTNAEYEQFDPGHRRLRADVADGEDDPVVFVTHADCLSYCRWRSEQEGLPSETYTLPTEAQWECAARGGSSDRIYPWGNELRSELCNTRETGPLRTLPANQGVPNPYGLYWIGSNVREWCRDWYLADYYKELANNVVDPIGPEPNLIVSMHVVRGASFQDPAYELGRCSARNYAHRDNSSNDVGFRCVRRAELEG
ncbi:MAG: SUMF1/EgtB/PvdO family nonheme iron enzyme [Planctomycetaceae bacterium]|nr:SUMF1/EgtB/PvdO family nonheme iron enzyme [Planctomycetaceae bacterium]